MGEGARQTNEQYATDQEQQRERDKADASNTAPTRRATQGKPMVMSRPKSGKSGKKVESREDHDKPAGKKVAYRIDPKTSRLIRHRSKHNLEVPSPLKHSHQVTRDIPSCFDSRELLWCPNPHYCPGTGTLLKIIASHTPTYFPLLASGK